MTTLREDIMDSLGKLREEYLHNARESKVESESDANYITKQIISANAANRIMMRLHGILQKHGL